MAQRSEPYLQNKRKRSWLHSRNQELQGDEEGGWTKKPGISQDHGGNDWVIMTSPRHQPWTHLALASREVTSQCSSYLSLSVSRKDIPSTFSHRNMRWEREAFHFTPPYHLETILNEGTAMGCFTTVQKHFEHWKTVIIQCWGAVWSRVPLFIHICRGKFIVRKMIKYFQKLVIWWVVSL